MAKKRKASSHDEAPKTSRELDPTDARLGPINTFEDVADSEDEYWAKEEYIAFNDDKDGEPEAKRFKKWELGDEKLEDSEEEVLGDDEDEDDEVDDYDEEYASDLERLQANLKRQKKRRILDPDEGGLASEDEEQDKGAEGWTGATRDEFYNADARETEEAAAEEEAEALKLQKKQLAQMTESDFIFDEDEWAASTQDAADGKKVATEMLEEVDIGDMDADQQYELLTRRYPEFPALAAELQQLHPMLAILQQEAQDKPPNSLQVVKYWTLACYVAALASYFAILTSPVRDEAGSSRLLDPSELREHSIMETLLHCRQRWTKVEPLKLKPKLDYLPLPLSDETRSESPPIAGLAVTENKAKAAISTAIDSAEAERVKTAHDSIADLQDLIRKSAKPQNLTLAKVNGNDLGEAELSDPKYAAEKIARTKSLRFYTSQIVQKSNKRTGARQTLGGDLDIPYRERLKDRQARLTALAQKRGSKEGPGAELDDGSSDEEDRAASRNLREDGDSDDAYYELVAGASKKKKEEKEAKIQALATANRSDHGVSKEEIGEDGKRKISYAIEKNRGLIQRRKRASRNPRVRKKEAYKSKQKKWSSVRPVFKGAPQGGYQGELSGIKKGLVKVTKLS